MRSVRLVLALAALGLGGACGSSLTSDTNSVANQQRSCLPAPVDAGPGACTIDVAFVSCEGPAGGCACLSDNPASCPDPQCGPTDGMTCKNACAANEYAMACGGLPGPNAPAYQDAPSNCRFATANPGGVAYYCCPCS